MQFYIYYHRVFVVLFSLFVSSPFTTTIEEPHSDDSGGIASSRTLHKSPSLGGESGNPFDDIELFNNPGWSPISGIHALNISSTDFFIDSIQVVYTLANFSDCQVPVRGTSWNPNTVSLDFSEHVTLIEGSTNDVAVTELTISTMGADGVGKMYGPFGKTSASEFSFQGYIVGFYGRSESFLTNLGVYYFDELKKSEEFGPIDGGSKFDDQSDISVPPIVGISTVTLWHGDFLNGIQAEYILLGGNKVVGEMHGGRNATLTTIITLEKGEKIDHATFGHMRNYGFISLLSFIVKRISGKTEVVGPFGAKGVGAYSFDGNVLGFYGHSGSYINRLGFYYT